MADVKASSFSVKFPAPVGSAYGIPMIFTVTATPGATNDTLKLALLPRSLTIVDGYVAVTDVDTNATPLVVFSLQVTDGTITKTLIHQSDKGQAGGLIRPTKSPATEDALGYTLVNDDFWLRLLYSTGAATGASGTFVVYVLFTGWYPYNAVTE